MRLHVALLSWTVAVAAVFTPRAASAHQLDEYLQAAILSVDRAEVRVELRLTPGVAVAPKVLAELDANGDGRITDDEASAYVERVRRDLSLGADGTPLLLRAVSWHVSEVDRLRDGTGEIEIDLVSSLPAGPRGRDRTIAFGNHHQPALSTYMANILVPADPSLEVTAQERSPDQSTFRVTLRDTAVSAARHWPPFVGLLSIALGVVALVWVVLRKRGALSS